MELKRIWFGKPFHYMDGFYGGYITGCENIVRKIWGNTIEEPRLESTREIPAFGGISLALRGSGALGATFRAPRRPFAAAFDGGKMKNKKNWGAYGAPCFGRPF